MSPMTRIMSCPLVKGHLVVLNKSGWTPQSSPGLASLFLALRSMPTEMMWSQKEYAYLIRCCPFPSSSTGIIKASQHRSFLLSALPSEAQLSSLEILYFVPGGPEGQPTCYMFIYMDYFL